ncbi:MAG: hypothetical protein GXD23_20930 [Comamonadaceae bacterium]|jgi:hypothetical protein|uniref:Uncharacterized protein n=1 Tax=Hydrogenophaga borbori TaxID=2294117 RepID=A0A372EH64_9BURK|nr:MULTISPECIES: hypothetical protein [Hydrogenophaga]NCT99843.1 hypothetical protein [Comamonadaceae bacterium]RFP77776.1 hypothetical protein DY262_14980 [Hydrogenophaga borbori]WQB82972.1 hypothetical protein SOM08_18545 [Hydrogenophaga sp. SNF1]
MVAKQRDMVQLSFLAHTRDVPDRIRLRDCGLGFAGQSADLSAGLITGVYGASAKQAALVAAARWTQEHQRAAGLNRVLMVDLNYRVDNFHLTREQARRDTVQETGWIHFDRIGAALRDELRDQWVEWIVRDTGTRRAAVADDSLVDLALKFPDCVAKTFQHEKAVRCIVHPVNPAIDPSIVLWAATLRYDKKRFEDASVRFLPHVQIQL